MQQAGQSNSPARETDRTAELDNQGILQMQQDVMQEQDQNLVAMEQSVASTRVCYTSVLWLCIGSLVAQYSSGATMS